MLVPSSAMHMGQGDNAERAGAAAGHGVGSGAPRGAREQRAVLWHSSCSSPRCLVAPRAVVPHVRARLPHSELQEAGVMPAISRALAMGEHLMDNTLSFCDVKRQNIAARTWRVLELSVAVNSGEGKALPEARGMCSALMESISRAERVMAEMLRCRSRLCREPGLGGT